MPRNRVKISRVIEAARAMFEAAKADAYLHTGSGVLLLWGWKALPEEERQVWYAMARRKLGGEKRRQRPA